MQKLRCGGSWKSRSCPGELALCPGESPFVSDRHLLVSESLFGFPEIYFDVSEGLFRCLGTSLPCPGGRVGRVGAADDFVDLAMQRSDWLITAMLGTQSM